MNSFFRFFLFLFILFHKGNFSIDNYLMNINVNDFYFLKEVVNTDISKFVGRLIIDSLKIDVFLGQSDDNKYFLNHDLYGNYDKDGTIFLDYRNTIDLDRKLLIYGHNSKSKNTIFSKLENYLSYDFFYNNDNNIIEIVTNNKKVFYEISNVLIVDEDTFGHMKLTFNDNTWNDYIKWINNNSLYGNDLKSSDSILVLQTCNYNPDNTFLLVIAKKKNEFYF